MDVTIAVKNVTRELEIDAEGSAAEIRALVDNALRNGGLLVLRDSKGREVLVPAESIGWVQLGEPDRSRVGFGG